MTIYSAVLIQYQRVTDRRTSSLYLFRASEEQCVCLGVYRLGGVSVWQRLSRDTATSISSSSSSSSSGRAEHTDLRAKLDRKRRR